MKSTKKIEELDEQTSSVMRFLEGEEVVARLDWDNQRYYVWLEPTWNFEDFCEEIGREDMLTELQKELAEIGVHSFCDLDGVNQFCKRYCGDEDPAQFYWDEFYGCPVGGM